MKIAIVKLSALGDIIHAMVVLQFIKKHHPETVIDWVVEEGFKGVLEHSTHISRIHTVNLRVVKQKKSPFLLFKELRKIRLIGAYDIVIDMQGLLKSALIARLIPSETTLGFDNNSLRESLASLFYNQTFSMDYAQNVIERNIALISHGLQISITQDDIRNKGSFLCSSQQHSFNELSKTTHNIALIPRASFQSKCYPVEKFVQLTTQLDANFLVVWGNEAEKTVAENIKASSPNVHVMSKLSLDELISLISQVDLVIGSDTGPTHMAWALNIPSITLFGPTPGYRNTYATDINRIIESETIVNPYKVNKNDFSIKNIKLSDIIKMSQDLLRAKP